MHLEASPHFRRSSRSTTERAAPTQRQCNDLRNRLQWGGRKATRVADGGFVQRVGTQKPVAEGRGATQDAAVGGVFWSLPHRGRRARSLPSAAQGEQGSPPPRRRNPGGSGAGAQATCADQSTGNAPNARCAWLSNHHKEASFSNPKVNSCGKDFMRATHASPAR